MAAHKANSRDITLHIDHVNHLFVVPEFDLESHRTIFGSGLDYIFTKMKSNWMHTKTVIIYLPPDKFDASLQAKITDMIQRYCAFKVEELRQEVISIRWQALKALQTGAIFLAICLFLSLFFREVAGLSDFLSRLLGEGFLIAGWVGIWKPSELFLYEWWPVWRDIQIHEHLQKLPITLKNS